MSVDCKIFILGMPKKIGTVTVIVIKVINVAKKNCEKGKWSILFVDIPLRFLKLGFFIATLDMAKNYSYMATLYISVRYNIQI